MFAVGDKVDVVGVSKGKGFSGVMKRHGFCGLRASHGVQRKHRSPGSIGACATPSRVFKGMRMAGQHGNARVTVLNLEVVQADRRAQPAARQGRGARAERRARHGAFGRQVARRGRGRLMATIDVLDAAGKKSGTRELPAELFEATVNVPLMHQVVVAGARRRSARARTRPRRAARSRGGGRKPWRQKGTGRARQGSIRSPQWVGGGVAHGPQPHDHAMRVNKKMREGALRSALTDALSSGKLAVVDELAFDEPKTKRAVELLSDARARGQGRRGRLPEPTATRRGREVASATCPTYGSPTPAGSASTTPLRRPGAVHRRGARRDRGPLAGTAAATGSGEGTEAIVKSPRDVIIRPIVSEKSYAGLEQNTYTFLVDPRANKTEIKEAIQAIWNVRVISVNTLNRRGKVKRRGYTKGKRPDEKRAIVTLAEGDAIEIFESGSVAMAVRKYKPTTPGRRGASVSTFDEITRATPEKSLRAEEARNKAGPQRARPDHDAAPGRRQQAAVPASIDFRRNKDGVPAKVAHIEYDPNRSARIALLHYADGEKRYILAPQGVKQGDTLMSRSRRRDPPGQRACRCATSRSAPSSTRSS